MRYFDTLTYLISVPKFLLSHPPCLCSCMSTCTMQRNIFLIRARVQWMWRSWEKDTGAHSIQEKWMQHACIRRAQWVHPLAVYVCTKPQLEVKWLTFSLVLNLEKRLQAATLSPAVFRANILASMFDTLKSQKHIFYTHDPSCQICSTWQTSIAPGAQTAEPALLQ